MRKLDITKVQKEFLVVLRNSFTQQGNVIYVIYVTWLSISYSKPLCHIDYAFRDKFHLYALTLFDKGVKFYFFLQLQNTDIRSTLSEMLRAAKHFIVSKATGFKCISRRLSDKQFHAFSCSCQLATSNFFFIEFCTQLKLTWTYK